MKRYFYMMPGRKLWFDLADILYQRGVAAPVLWLGDNRHMNSAAARFPDCEIVDFERARFETDALVKDYDGELVEFVLAPEFERVKDIATKMMDRIDATGLLRRVDREVLFYSTVAWAAKAIKKYRPDFGLFGESPHSHTQYLMFELCNYVGIKTLVFGQWSIAPVLYLREGVDGKRVSVGDRNGFESIDTIVYERIREYISTVRSDDGSIEKPEYMKAQTRAHQRRMRDGIGAKVLRKIAFKASVIAKGKRSEWNNRANNRALKFIREGQSPFRNIDTGHIVDAYRYRQSEYLGRFATNTVPDTYVYFPMHYEPERTTCPDGGQFHDQIKALVCLRAMLNDDIALCVKEHFSQVALGMHGYVGRSPLIYPFIDSMRNTYLVTYDKETADLMGNALLTATISGTAALEAALLERKALHFGHAWYEGCPNTVRYNHDIKLEKFLESAIESRVSVAVWLQRMYLREGVPGLQNPSGEKVFKDFCTNPDLLGAEREGAVQLVEKAIRGL